MPRHSIYKSAAGEAAIKTKYNDLLRHWPVEKEELRIPTRHGTTFVIASGNPHSPPVLLLHGSGTNSIIWMKDVETLYKSHRVYAVDIIGEPNHSDPQRPSIKGPAYAEWLEDLINELRIDKVKLVGISLGAWMCLKFACTWPERVERLVLMCPAGIVRERGLFKLETLLLMLFLGPLGKKILYRRIRKGADINPKFADYSRFVFKHFKPRLANMPRFSPKQLSQLYCPILLIVGAKDVFYSPRKMLLRLARSVPQLEINYRPRDGHLLTACTREIDRFLLTEYPPE